MAIDFMTNQTDATLDNRQLFTVLHEFMSRTNYGTCDAVTLLTWGLWLERQIPDERQFYRACNEYGLIDRILRMTIAETQA